MVKTPSSTTPFKLPSASDQSCMLKTPFVQSLS
jgi:hypothetical protein